jgi:hypothetical protein
VEQGDVFGKDVSHIRGGTSFPVLQMVPILQRRDC